MTRWTRLGVAALAALAWACEGKIGSAGERSSDSESPAPSAPTGEGSEGEASRRCGPPAVRIWKLSPEQLQRTLEAALPGAADLRRALAGTLSPGRRFTGEVATLDLTEPHVRVLQEGMAREAERALANPEAVGLPGCATSPDEACAGSVLDTLVPKALRRPIQHAERETWLAFYRQEAQTHGDAVALNSLLRVVLTGPGTLFRSELGEGDGAEVTLGPYEIASALSYFVTGGPPGAELLGAAASGALGPDERAAHARRLTTLETAAGIRTFLHEHFHLDRVLSAEKDGEDFDVALGEEMREESERFLDYVVFEGPGTFEALLSSRVAFLTERLAELYGVAPPAEPWSQAELPAAERAGLLTRLSFLAGHGREQETDIVHRGLYVRERLLCLSTPPPPPTIAALPLPPDGNLTHRERLVAHQEDPTCASCHAEIDPAGFVFEMYDTMGRHRTRDAAADRPIDPSGAIAGSRSSDAPLADALALSTHLAASTEAEDCFVDALQVYAYGGEEAAHDDCESESLRQRFRESGGDIPALVEAIVRSPRFVTRTR